MGGVIGKPANLDLQRVSQGGQQPPRGGGGLVDAMGGGGRGFGGGGAGGQNGMRQPQNQLQQQPHGYSGVHNCNVPINAHGPLEFTGQKTVVGTYAEKVLNLNTDWALVQQ